MYSYYTNKNSFEAISPDFNSEGKLTVVFGKIGHEGRFKRKIVDDIHESYENRLKDNGYFYTGTAVFSQTGKLLNLDAEDTLYWSLNKSANAITKFRNGLLRFQAIFKQTQDIELSITNNEQECFITLNDLIIGIGLNQDLNRLDYLGNGGGQVSLVQNQEAIWLLLYLHKLGVINLFDNNEKELKTKKCYPSWLTQLLALKEFNSLANDIGFGNPFSNIKPFF